eukprot:333361_1
MASFHTTSIRINNENTTIQRIDNDLNWLVQAIKDHYPDTFISPNTLKQEYAKFLYLKLKCNDFNHTLLSPSKQIDDIWHLHILFNRKYFEFCRIYGGALIEHDPNAKFDIKEYKKRFKNTHKKYKEYFHIKPPQSVWDNIPNEILTSLHTYPMVIGTHQSHQGFKWMCDNKSCSKNKKHRQYKMIYWASSQIGDKFTLCNECVLSHRTNTKITNNSATTTSKRKSEESKAENDKNEPPTKKIKLSSSNQLSTHNNAPRTNATEAFRKQSASRKQLSTKVARKSAPAC